MIPLTRTLETENPYLRAMGADQLTFSQSQVNAAVFATPTMGTLAVDMLQLDAAGPNVLGQALDDRALQADRFRFDAAQITTAMETASDDELPALRDQLYALEDGYKSGNGGRSLIETMNIETQKALAAGKVMSPTVLAEKYPVPGLKFDYAMSDAQAKILSDGKKAEIIRNAIIEAGPGGFVSGVQKFGVSLVAMATDPLEVATMFIPVVGAAGKAAAVARFGKIGGRIAVGAVEGGVGNALTEPFYAGMSRSMQLDYTMQDSLMNIGLGFVLGGGIGAVAGIASRGSNAAHAARVDVEAPDMAARVEVITPEALAQRTEATREDWRARQETMRLADEQRPVAQTALRQMATDQAVEVAPVMPRLTIADEIAALSAELQSARKYPLTFDLRAKGIDPKGDVGLALAHAGVTPRTAPGLFKMGGLKNLDNIVASEMERDHPGISQIAGVTETNGIPNGYLSEEGLVQAIISELAGRDIGLPSKAAVAARLSPLERDAAHLADVHAQAAAAGVNLRTEAEVRFAADMMARGVPVEQLNQEAALAKNAGIDPLADDTVARKLETPVPYDQVAMTDHIADLQSQADQLRMNEELLTPEQKLDFDAIDAEQERYQTYAAVAEAAATCLART